jgi:hypothetical protein
MKIDESELTIREDFGSFYWSEALCCYVNSLRIRSPWHVEIYLSSLSCTDMRGAINAAKAIMPTVTLIDTFAVGQHPEGQRDTRYRFVDGKWISDCSIRITSIARRRASGALARCPRERKGR